MKMLNIRDRFITIDLLQTAIIEQDSDTIRISGESFSFTGNGTRLHKQWFTCSALNIERRVGKQTVQSDREKTSIEE